MASKDMMGSRREDVATLDPSCGDFYYYYFYSFPIPEEVGGRSEPVASVQLSISFGGGGIPKKMWSILSTWYIQVTFLELEQALQAPNSCENLMQVV